MLHHVNIAELDNLPLKEVANVINGAFLEPMKAYQLVEPLHKIPLEQSDAEFLELSEARVYNALRQLNPAKACGPDNIPNWILKEYAELLLIPIIIIITAHCAHWHVGQQQSPSTSVCLWPAVGSRSSSVLSPSILSQQYDATYS